MIPRLSSTAEELLLGEVDLSDRVTVAGMSVNCPVYVVPFSIVFHFLV